MCALYKALDKLIIAIISLCNMDCVHVTFRIYNTNYLVYPIFVFIVGIAGLNKLKAIMGIPHQQSSSTFKLNQAKFLENKIPDTALGSAGVSEQTRGDWSAGRGPRCCLGSGMPISTVKIDGSWSKVGFTSNFSFIVVLSARTGKY